MYSDWIHRNAGYAKNALTTPSLGCAAEAKWKLLTWHAVHSLLWCLTFSMQAEISIKQTHIVTHSVDTHDVWTAKWPNTKTHTHTLPLLISSHISLSQRRAVSPVWQGLTVEAIFCLSLYVSLPEDNESAALWRLIRLTLSVNRWHQRWGATESLAGTPGELQLRYPTGLIILLP